MRSLSVVGNEDGRAWAALWRGFAVLVALSVLGLGLVVGFAELVLAARWLWTRYRDLAIAASLLAPCALLVSILVSAVRRTLATGDDHVSPETLRRLRDEEPL